MVSKADRIISIFRKRAKNRLLQVALVSTNSTFRILCQGNRNTMAAKDFQEEYLTPYYCG